MGLDYDQYKLVWEALHEQRIFLHTTPYLSSILPIMLLIYKYWQVPLILLRVQTVRHSCWQREHGVFICHEQGKSFGDLSNVEQYWSQRRNSLLRWYFCLISPSL
jgi:hypothetical protein